MRTFAQKVSAIYRRLFSIGEIETQPILQWMFGASLFYFFVSFGRWIADSSITVEAAERGNAVCWPFFQNCTDFYFLHLVPFGYSQSTLYMIFYGMMVLMVYLMWKKDWVQAHALMLALFLWKLFVISMSFTISGPYDNYHIILTSMLLFVPHKEYFLKLSFVIMYFVSATIKFSDA